MWGVTVTSTHKPTPIQNFYRHGNYQKKKEKKKQGLLYFGWGYSR